MVAGPIFDSTRNSYSINRVVVVADTLFVDVIVVESPMVVISEALGRYVAGMEKGCLLYSIVLI